MKKVLFFCTFLIFAAAMNACANFGANEKTQAQIEAEKADLEARIEAARKADSLLNMSRTLEEDRNLTQVFSGVHSHGMGIRTSGNLAFDAHQDPEATRRLIQNYAILAERYREEAPKVEEARRRMIEQFQEKQREEQRRLY